MVRRRPAMTRATAAVAAAIVLVAVASAGVRQARPRRQSQLASAAAAAPATVADVPVALASVPPAQGLATPRRRIRRLTLPAVPALGALRLPILMYHRIDRPSALAPPITQRLTVAPAAFAAQMQWLADHGYHALSERQVFDAEVGGHRLPARSVVVTFDDGYRDVLRYAVPVLQRLHL